MSAQQHESQLIKLRNLTDVRHKHTHTRINNGHAVVVACDSFAFNTHKTLKYQLI